MAGYRNNNQERILEFIQQHTKEKGYPPSVREICTAVGLKSTSTVHGHLQRLERRGLLRRDQTKPRAIEVLVREEKKETIDLPIIGVVTAGLPILAEENVEDTFPVPEAFVSNGNEHFMLRVKGESMIDAGILDGDYVIVQKENTARNGDIIVALIEDEATIKTFYKESDHIRLQPENPTMEPIRVRDVSVLGHVVGLFRNMRH